MKIRLTLILVSLLLNSCAEKDFRQTIEIINATAEEVPLNENEVAAALKDAADLFAAETVHESAYKIEQIARDHDLRQAVSELHSRRVGTGQIVLTHYFLSSLQRYRNLIAQIPDVPVLSGRSRCTRTWCRSASEHSLFLWLVGLPV